MALIVNGDSYVTLEEANSYLELNHITSDPALIAWQSMSDDDNEVLLRQAVNIINRQPLVGYVVDTNQVLAFPRYLYTSGPLEDDSLNNVVTFYGGVVSYVRGGLYKQLEVPKSVKDAQCEIALELALGPNQRQELQRHGVKSFSVPGLSETYDGSYNNLVSYKALELLSPFLNGGFNIC